jgi:hypothetical protein
MTFARFVIFTLVFCFNIILCGGAYASVQSVTAFETLTEQSHDHHPSDEESNSTSNFPPLYEELIHDETTLLAPFEASSHWISAPMVPLNSISLAPLHRPPSNI